jgi:hypothetical protein
MGDKKSKYEFNSGSILFFFFKKIRTLVTVGIIAAIISGIVAFVIKPKFKSTVIIFPTSDASVSKSILNTQYVTSKGGDLMNFGGEDQADQLLQVLNSKDIKDLIDKKYHLMTHYGLDSLKVKYAKTKYYDWFNANFSFRRTEYLSVVIEVLDTDPVLAAAMADDVAAFADTIIDRTQKVRSYKAYLFAKEEYENLQKNYRLVIDSVEYLRKMGIYDFKDHQSKIVEKAYYRALDKGQPQVANDLKKKLDLLSKYATQYDRTRYWSIYLQSQLSALHYKYSEAKAEYLQKLPHKYVVESARIAEKKSYPKRSLVILVSVLSAVFFAFVLMLGAESIKKYN